MGGYGAYSPKPWCAWLTPLMFVGCIGMFIYTMYINNCPAHLGGHNCVGFNALGRYAFQPQQENRMFGPSTHTLRELGALDRKAVVEEKQYWRLFSSMWLHSGAIHLLFNMFSLLCTGIQMEEEYGFFKIGVLYVISGFGGSLLSVLRPKPQVTVGASGALFGLLGAMISELITNWNIYANKCAAIFIFIVILGMNVVIGYVIPGMDHWSHLGGLVTGFILGFILLPRPRYGLPSGDYIASGYDMKHIKPKHQCHQYVFWIIALVAFISLYWIGLNMLVKGETYAEKFPIPGFD